MIGKIIQLIPGTGHSIGDNANFDYEEYARLVREGFIVPVAPENAMITPRESAVIKKSRK